MRRFSNPARLLPVVLSGAAGVLVLGALIARDAMGPIGDGILAVAQVTTAIGLLFGLLHVVFAHGRRAWTRARGWPYSVALVVVAVAVFALELVSGLSVGVASTTVTGLTTEVFRYVYEPLAMSILALLTFFALRAAWRALQARPGDALLILLPAVVFLIGSGPWSAFVPGVRETLDWIRGYPALGVARGLLLGVGLGALVAAVRLLLGFDQPYLDR